MKRKLRLLAVTGFISGIYMIICSSLRWLIKFNDPSQATIGISVGIIICVFAYIYQRFVELSADVKDLRKGLDLQNMWIRHELKKVKKK